MLRLINQIQVHRHNKGHHYIIRLEYFYVVTYIRDIGPVNLVT